MVDFLENTTPYVGTLIGWMITIRLDHRHSCCHSVGRQKKTFSARPDVPLSDEKIQHRLEWLRYCVKIGRISEELH